MIGKEGDDGKTINVDIGPLLFPHGDWARAVHFWPCGMTLLSPTNDHPVSFRGAANGNLSPKAAGMSRLAVVNYHTELDERAVIQPMAKFEGFFTLIYPRG